MLAIVHFDEGAVFVVRDLEELRDHILKDATEPEQTEEEAEQAFNSYVEEYSKCWYYIVPDDKAIISLLPSSWISSLDELFFDTYGEPKSLDNLDKLILYRK